MRYAYPVLLEPDEGGSVVVSFPDVPGALTEGKDEADAMALSEDCLIAALGGYVKLVGMLPPAKDDPSNRPRAGNTGMFTQLISDARAAEYEHIGPGDGGRLFYRLPWWKKVIVMAGGPSVNLLIAFVLFAGIFGLHGTYEPTRTVSVVSRCVISAEDVDRECTAADPPSPAAQAGLRPGDVIVSKGYVLGGGRVAVVASAQGRPDPVLTNAWAEVG